MLNIGPMEFIVLAVVGLIVLGPERLPTVAKDAARLLRSLREMATGARAQFRDELGPEFADLDLRSLDPRTALTKALFSDDEPAPPSTNGSSPSLQKPGSRPAAPENDGPAPYDPDTT